MHSSFSAPAKSRPARHHLAYAEHRRLPTPQWYEETLGPILSEVNASLLLFRDFYPATSWPCKNTPLNPDGAAGCQGSYGRASDADIESRISKAFGQRLEVHYSGWTRDAFCTSHAQNSYQCGVEVRLKSGSASIVGYSDEGHANRKGAASIAPFLCSQFDEWGYFD